MEKARVLVIDDSPFSQKIITDILTNADYKICDCCDSGRSGWEKYQIHQPDIVTMDLTLPDMNGFECCAKILSINPLAKFVVLSAMKDEQLIARGHALGITEFLQKPLTPEKLLAAMDRILLKEHVNHKKSSQKIIEFFIHALVNNLSNIAGLDSTTELLPGTSATYISHGMTLIIGITGSRQGRIIIDMSNEIAVYIADKMLGKQPADDAVLVSMSEFANIIAGHCISPINDLYKSQNIELRLTPPSILLGESLRIINLKLGTTTIKATTNAGTLYMNVGFIGGNDLGCQTH